jgi:hypothetical protein
MTLIGSVGPRVNQPLDQMLMIFECRVDVWQQGPAVEMLKLMDSAHDQTSVWWVRYVPLTPRLEGASRMTFD